MPGSSRGSASDVFRSSATSFLNGQCVTTNLYRRSLNRHNSDAIFLQACLQQYMFLLMFLSGTLEEAIRGVVKHSETEYHTCKSVSGLYLKCAFNDALNC
jgi:hypothetical protein